MAATLLGRSPLDELADELLELDEDELARALALMEPPDLAVVEIAFRRRLVEEWRVDPSALAEHLDPGNYQRFAYTRIIGSVMRRAIDTAAGADIPDPLTRAMIWMPTRYGKTTTTSVWSPVWGLDRHPWLKFILASYGQELAVASSLSIRDIVETHANVLRVQVRRSKRAAKAWYTTDGGQVRAVGAGSGLTGHGGDVLIGDDLFKDWQEAHSPTIRDARWNWFRSVLYTRQQTGHSSIVLPGTRWHEDDVHGRLLDPPGDVEREDWEIIRMPALAEAPSTLPNAPDWERLPDPLGRAPGEPLEPRRFDLKAVRQRLAALGSYLASALEQQRPSSADGEILKRKWWRFYGARPIEDAEDWLISWDASFADKAGSSFCVGQCWARKGAHRMLIDQTRARMDYPTFRASVLSMYAKWPQASRTLIENKANGPAVIADLQGIIPGLVGREPRGSKESRAHAVSGLIEAGNVWLPDPGLDPIDADVTRAFVHDFVDECAQFPNGSNDDQVDAMTQALLEWQGTDIPDQSSYRRTTGTGRR